jgi:putative Holliday junction resolvase
MRVLALDVGTKMTGVAIGDTDTGIPLPRPTIEHHSPEELADTVQKLVEEEGIEKIVIGLPMLSSGDEGKQAQWSRRCGDLIVERCQMDSVEYFDERHTNKSAIGPDSQDPHSQAACAILGVVLERLR